MTAEHEDRWLAIAAHAMRPFFPYARFAGRASRDEFRWFLLAAVLMLATAYLLDWLILGSTGWTKPDFFRLAGIALLIPPMLAVTVRRLRDIASNAFGASGPSERSN